MARRSSGFRAPADLDDALYDLGIQVHRTNDDEVIAHCPGHLEKVGREDQHPTWSVNRDTGLHNCYSCGFQGTFLELVMYLKFPNDVFSAARWLRQYGSSLARAAALTNFASRETTDAEVEALELLPETKLAMFGPVPDWALEARRLSRESVDHYGIRWNEKRDSWIIPIRMPSQDLLGWQEKWQTKRRFMNRPKDMRKAVTLFGYGVFPIGEPAVLLESPLDVCRLYTVGYEGGLASFGSSVSLEQITLLKEATDELVVAMDDDKAGRVIAEELRVGKWERGQLTRPSVAKYFNLRFFAYDQRLGLKDIGDMDDADVTRGLYNAQHASVARLGDTHVHRNPSPVPGRPRRADGRQRTLPADRWRGNGQDRDDRGSLRGARRGVR